MHDPHAPVDVPVGPAVGKPRTRPLDRAFVWVQGRANLLLAVAAALLAVVVVANLASTSNPPQDLPFAATDTAVEPPLSPTPTPTPSLLVPTREPRQLLVVLDASQAGQILPVSPENPPPGHPSATSDGADTGEGVPTPPPVLLSQLQQLLEQVGGELLELDLVSGPPSAPASGSILVQVPTQHAGSVLELAAQAAPVRQLRLLGVTVAPSDTDLAGRLSRLQRLERKTRSELADTAHRASPNDLSQAAALLGQLQDQQRQVLQQRLGAASQPDVTQVRISLQLPERSSIPVWPVLALALVALVAVGVKDRVSQPGSRHRRAPEDVAW